MKTYRRIYQSGGYYFFTLVTKNRQLLFKKKENVLLLKNSIQKIKKRHPFKMNAYVILPDHLHCIWKLPNLDADFSTRWRLIKRDFTIAMGQPGLWQLRFWEHLIRDYVDWQNHMNYIHFNPVKHEYVDTPKLWKNSSFHYWVEKGLYDEDWVMDI